MNRVILDTETANTLEEPLVYDFGYVIVDSKWRILAQRRVIVAETWHTDGLMESAYYAKKLPAYRAMVEAGTLEVKSFFEIWREFSKTCRDLKVKEVWAHNASFDRHALNNTIKTYSNGFCRFFVPYGMKWRCTQALAASTICQLHKYFSYCVKNDLLTSHGNVPTTAEAIYGFITDNSSFIEAHTALDDALIELEILKAGKRRKCKIDQQTPSRYAWKRPQKKFQSWRKKVIDN